MLFNIFGKRKSDWKLDIDGVEKGECTVEDVKIDNVEVYRELVKTISDDKGFLQNMDRCFCYPREYFKIMRTGMMIGVLQAEML